MDQMTVFLSTYAADGLDADLCGYIASALVLATFSMKSMRLLRLTAIASNIAFIFYAYISNLHPILVLHCILLPLNVFRLAQLQTNRTLEKYNPDRNRGANQGDKIARESWAGAFPLRVEML
jgi:hypothetical protein